MNPIVKLGHLQTETIKLLTTCTAREIVYTGMYNYVCTLTFTQPLKFLL